MAGLYSMPAMALSCSHGATSMPPPVALSCIHRPTLEGGGVAAPRLVWVRAGERSPDLAGAPDHFIALDGEEEVGVVKADPRPAVRTKAAGWGDAADRAGSGLLATDERHHSRE